MSPERIGELTVAGNAALVGGVAWARARFHRTPRSAVGLVAQRGLTGPGIFSYTGSMNVARSAHTATLLPGGDVLIVGGVSSSAERYQPISGMFTLTAGAAIDPREFHTATLLKNGKVLITGGQPGGFSPGIARAELYDPVTDSFSATSGPMQVARTSHTATLLGSGKVLLVGGSGATASTSAELFDPSTGTFTALSAALHAPRERHTATLLTDGRVLIEGGTGGAPSAELFDEGSATFVVTGAPSFPRSHHTATLLQNGKVLFAGGFNGFASYPMGVLAAAELYDPSAGTFASAGTLVTAREQHTATLLLDGRVLFVGGGATAANTRVGTPEFYDPDAGTFDSRPEQINTVRELHTATRLNNGKVLVTGGAGAAGGNDAVLYW